MKIDENLKTAALGGAFGASAVLLILSVGGALGWMPLANDARLRQFLMDNPRIIYDMAAKAQADDAKKTAAERQKAIEKLGMKAFFDPAIAYVAGPKDAKNSFVAFFDYNCIHCRNTIAAVKTFYEAHKHDTRFAFIEMPINGAESEDAARTAIAARKQGDAYLKLHFLLMSEKAAIDARLLYEAATKAGLDIPKLSEDLTKPEVDKAILGARKLAEQIQVNGTPTFIVNGKAHDGEITVEEIDKLMK